MKRETLADLEQMEIDNVNAIGMKEDEIVQKQQKLFASRDKNKQKRQALVQKLAELDMEGESIIREIGAIVNNVEMLEQKRQTDDVKRLVENMDVEIPEELMDTD